MQVMEMNTLQFDESKCNGCRMCIKVCPHGVFAEAGNKVELVRYEGCMECGACALSCPQDAIEVESGVGCASAMIKAALTGSEEECCG